MEKPNAVANFHGEHRYNCAQAVLVTYASTAGVDQACVTQFSQYGGGRAPGGECGALFTAKALVQDPAAKQEIEREFVGVVGTSQCREIRQGRLASCEQCVQAASDALFARVAQGCSLQPPL